MIIQMTVEVINQLAIPSLSRRAAYIQSKTEQHLDAYLRTPLEEATAAARLHE